MIFINEWLPNPIGNDVSGEVIELYNDDTIPVKLYGWRLITKGGKQFTFSEHTIPAHGFLVLPRSESKLTLHNTDGSLVLLNNVGEEIHSAMFYGTAPEGGSYSFLENHFFFTEPTIGFENNSLASASLINTIYQNGTKFNTLPTNAEMFMLGIVVALVLSIAVVFTTHRDDHLQKLFLRRD